MSSSPKNETSSGNELSFSDDSQVPIECSEEEESEEESEEGSEDENDQENEVDENVDGNIDHDISSSNSSSSSSSSSSDGSDNEEDCDGQENVNEYRKGGYNCVEIGNIYNHHYRIVRKLGWGYFSTVWLCWDIEKKTCAALKIVKSGIEFSEAAADEIKLLKCISEADRSDPCRERIIQLSDSFKIHGCFGKHYCLVTEVLGPNLLKLIVQSKYKGLSLVNVKIIMFQILEGLKYLHEKCKIIHTDLKPENVLIVPQPKFVWHAAAQLFSAMVDPTTLSPNMITSHQYAGLKKNLEQLLKDKCDILSASDTSHGDTVKDKKNISCEEMDVCEKLTTIHRLMNQPSSLDASDLLYNGKDPSREECAIPIKIADLGNACWTHRHFSSGIQTLQYRCIETIIRVPYDTPSDIWSAACMAFELATGNFLFDPSASRKFTRSQHHIASFVEILGEIPKSFAVKGKLYAKYFNKKGCLRCPAERRTSIKKLLLKKYRWNERDATEFSEFLLPMLVYNPDERASASEMLNHDWFSGLHLQQTQDGMTFSFDREINKN